MFFKPLFKWRFASKYRPHEWNHLKLPGRTLQCNKMVIVNQFCLCILSLVRRRMHVTDFVFISHILQQRPDGLSQCGLDFLASLRRWTMQKGSCFFLFQGKRKNLKKWKWMALWQCSLVLLASSLSKSPALHWKEEENEIIMQNWKKIKIRGLTFQPSWVNVKNFLRNNPAAWFYSCSFDTLPVCCFQGCCLCFSLVFTSS